MSALHGFNVFREWFFWVNFDKHPAAAGQHVTLLIHDLGHMEMAASIYPQFSGLDAQRLIQRNRFQEVYGHLRGHGGDLAELVQFAHRVVEDGGDDSTVAVPGRSAITFAETEAAGKPSPFFVMDKFQMHAVEIVFAAGKAKVFGGFEVFL